MKKDIHIDNLQKGKSTCHRTTFLFGIQYEFM